MRTTKTIKYLVLLLIGLGSANTLPAQDPVPGTMVCSSWTTLTEGPPFTNESKCFFILDPGDPNAKYCVTNTQGMYLDSNGFPCDPDGDLSGCEAVNSFWTAGGGCNTGGAMAVLPLTDTYLPFVFLLGTYSLFISRRKRKCRPAM